MNDVHYRYNMWRNFLLSHIFSFGVSEGTTYTHDFKFNPDGHIDGYTTYNETYWELLDDKKILLKNPNFDVTTEIELPADFSFDLNNRIVGTYLANPEVKHELVAVAEKEGNNPTTVAQRIDELPDDMYRNTQMSAHIATSVRKMHNKTIHVAFIVNSVETIPALLPLMRALISDERFEVKIIASNKQLEGVTLSTIDNLCEFLDGNLNYAYIRITDKFWEALDDLRSWNPDFIIRQSEWDKDFPEAFSADNLAWTRLIHIPYTVTEGFLYAPHTDNQSLLVNPYYQKTWRYFMPESLTKEEHEAIQKSFISEDCFETVGSMKAVMIKNAKPEWPIANSTNPKVVWMAHHSIGNDWFNMGMFLSIYKDVLNWIKAHPRIDVVFNPHPLLRKIIYDREGLSISYDEYMGFLEEINALPNAIVYKDAVQYNMTAAADVVLTDGVSSIYEMQLQRKKIVTLLRSDHNRFTERGNQLITGTHVFGENQIHDALEKVERLLSVPNPKLDQEVKNTAEWLQNDHPEQNIIEAMVREIDRLQIL